MAVGLALALVAMTVMKRFLDRSFGAVTERCNVCQLCLEIGKSSLSKSQGLLKTVNLIEFLPMQ